jgi:hypothetical protein
MIESITLKAVNDSVAAADVKEASQKPAQAEVVKEVEAPKAKNSVAKNVGLFFASPFIALGYVIALPFVGFYMFVKLGREAFIKKHMSE